MSIDLLTFSLTSALVFTIAKIFYDSGRFSEFRNNVKENMREIRIELKELRK